MLFSKCKLDRENNLLFGQTRKCGTYSIVARGFVRKVPVNKTRRNRDNIKNNFKEIYQVDGKDTGSGLPQMIHWLLLRFKISFIACLLLS